MGASDDIAEFAAPSCRYEVDTFTLRLSYVTHCRSICCLLAPAWFNASWSWETVLKSHLRAPDQPKQKVTITYGPTGDYPDIAEAVRATGMLEILADAEGSRYIWRRPIGFDVKSCGQPDLHWELSTQKILVCYEMAADFGQLYRDYGLTNDAFKAAVAQLGQLGKQKK